jgi:hypothetical protein
MTTTQLQHDTEMKQCEFCDEFFHPEHGCEWIGGRHGKSHFCSKDCFREAQEEIRIADCEARREFDLYGDDLDSWYR